MLCTSAYNVLTAPELVSRREQLYAQNGVLYTKSGWFGRQRCIWLQQGFVRWTGGGNVREAELTRSLGQCQRAMRHSFASLARAQEIYERALGQVLGGGGSRAAFDAAGSTLLKEVYPRIRELRDHPNLWLGSGARGLALLHERFTALYGLLGEEEALPNDWNTLEGAITISQRHARLVELEESLGMQIPFVELGEFLAGFARGGVEAPEAVVNFAEAINGAEELTVSQLHLFLGDVVRCTPVYAELDIKWRPLLCPALEHELEVLGCTRFQDEDSEYQEQIASLEEVEIDGKRYRLGEQLKADCRAIVDEPKWVLVFSLRNAAGLGIREVARDAYDREIGVPRLQRVAMHPLGWCALYERPADRAVDRAISRGEPDSYDKRLEATLIEQFSELAQRGRMPHCTLCNALFVTEDGELRWDYEPEEPVELDPAAIEQFFLEMARYDTARVIGWMRTTAVALGAEAARQRDVMVAGEAEDKRLKEAHTVLQGILRRCVSDLRNDYEVPEESKLLKVLQSLVKEILTKHGVVGCFPDKLEQELLQLVLERKRYSLKERFFSKRLDGMRATAVSAATLESENFYWQFGMYDLKQIARARGLLAKSFTAAREGRSCESGVCESRSQASVAQSPVTGSRRSLRGRIHLGLGS